jgi:hypothetical protein
MQAGCCLRIIAVLQAAESGPYDHQRAEGKAGDPLAGAADYQPPDVAVAAASDHDKIGSDSADRGKNGIRRISGFDPPGGCHP